MNYSTLILTLALIIIFGPWLYRRKIRPFFEQKQLAKWLEHSSRKIRIKAAQKKFESLYRNVNATLTSKMARITLNITDEAFTYGEIDFLSFILLLEEAKPKPGEVFYDLGSGAGKAVFAAALCYDFSKCCGIEYLNSLHALAQKIHSKYQSLYPKLSEQLPIQFIQNDFTLVDLSDANIIFINATCYREKTWERILLKLLTVPPGTRILITSKRLDRQEFKLLYSAMHLMSWGMNSAYIYLKL